MAADSPAMPPPTMMQSNSSSIGAPEGVREGGAPEASGEAGSVSHRKRYRYVFSLG
ncbi:MAG: hypothetical protein AAFQ43_04230 [Bacteroidota bacterium]